MPSYAQLIQDLAFELGGSVPSELPFLIHSVEDELWADLWFLAPPQSVQFTLLANHSPVMTASSLLGVSIADLLSLESISIQDRPYSLRRVSLSQFNRLNQVSSIGVPEVFTFSKRGDYIGFYPVASKDLQLVATIRLRDTPIQDGDDETTKVMLGDAYNVLKYGVLMRRFFNPDKIGYWKEQYANSLLSLYRKFTRESYTYRGGTYNYDSPTTY